MKHVDFLLFRPDLKVHHLLNGTTFCLSLQLE
jgi:hypothetical protein